MNQLMLSTADHIITAQLHFLEIYTITSGEADVSSNYQSKIKCSTTECFSLFETLLFLSATVASSET